MRQVSVPEYGDVLGLPLAPAERDFLAALGKALSVRPSLLVPGAFDLEASGYVGAAVIDGLSLEIRPKVPLASVLFMVSYAIDPTSWRDWDFGFDTSGSILDAVALGFAGQLRRATRRGIHCGYRHTEEALSTVRGRIRIEEQLRRRFGQLLPIEVWRVSVVSETQTGG